MRASSSSSVPSKLRELAARAAAPCARGAAGPLASASAPFDPLLPVLPDGLPPCKGPEQEVHSAQFIKSSVRMHHMPPEHAPEFAFIGHSNVGKSSLINLITASELANVSKRPGRTTAINHYLINGRFYLVDCPGYGHARAAKAARAEWHALVRVYLLRRRTLAHAFLLVDSAKPPNSLDVDAALWLAAHRVPHILVFTKAEVSGHVAGEAASAASTIPTFCNAVRVLTQQQQQQQQGQQHQQQQQGQQQQGQPQRGADQHTGRAQGEGAPGHRGPVVAACARGRPCLPVQELRGGPPYYVATSAVTGAGRGALLEYMAQLRRAFTMPVVFRA